MSIVVYILKILKYLNQLNSVRALKHYSEVILALLGTKDNVRQILDSA